MSSDISREEVAQALTERDVLLEQLVDAIRVLAQDVIKLRADLAAKGMAQE